MPVLLVRGKEPIPSCYRNRPPGRGASAMDSRSIPFNDLQRDIRNILLPLGNAGDLLALGFVQRFSAADFVQRGGAAVDAELGGPQQLQFGRGGEQGLIGDPAPSSAASL